MLINFTIHVFSLRMSEGDIQRYLNPPRKYYYIHGSLNLYIVIFDPMVQLPGGVVASHIHIFK